MEDSILTKQKKKLVNDVSPDMTVGCRDDVLSLMEYAEIRHI